MKLYISKEEDEGSDTEALKDILPLPGDLLDADLINIMNDDDDGIKAGENLEDIAGKLCFFQNPFFKCEKYTNFF